MFDLEIYRTRAQAGKDGVETRLDAMLAELRPAPFGWIDGRFVEAVESADPAYERLRGARNEWYMPVLETQRHLRRFIPALPDEAMQSHPGDGLDRVLAPRETKAFFEAAERLTPLLAAPAIPQALRDDWFEFIAEHRRAMEALLGTTLEEIPENTPDVLSRQTRKSPLSRKNKTYGEQLHAVMDVYHDEYVALANAIEDDVKHGADAPYQQTERAMLLQGFQAIRADTALRYDDAQQGLRATLLPMMVDESPERRPGDDYRDLIRARRSADALMWGMRRMRALVEPSGLVAFEDKQALEECMDRFQTFSRQTLRPPGGRTS